MNKKNKTPHLAKQCGKISNNTNTTPPPKYF